MAGNFSFEDAFRRVVQDNADLRAGKIDVSKAIGLHAGHVALDKLLNTAIKYSAFGARPGTALPPLGGTIIFGGAVDEVAPIDGVLIDQDAVKRIAGIPEGAKPAPKVRKPKFGFIGLPPNQAGEISTMFGEFADCLFWMDEAMPRLKPIAACDVVFASNQISHKATEYLEANGLDMSHNFVKVTGAVSAMKHAVKARAESLSK